MLFIVLGKLFPVDSMDDEIEATFELPNME